MAMKSSLPLLLLTLLLVLIQDAQGRLTNKHFNSVKVSTLGGLFDCVDINKQPAFDHPLLKDHKIQMRPSWISDDLYDEMLSTSIIESVDCPTGTVPIRRIPKSIKSNSSAYAFENAKFPGESRAMIYFPNRSGKKIFYGATATMNLINPPIGNDQAVESSITVSSSTNQVTLGWAVNPSLYNGHKTHLYTSWKGDGEAGCANLRCPGFVQVNTKFPVDAAFFNVSVYDGKIFEVRMFIVQDSKDGNWWAILPNQDIKLGYWPAALFPQLQTAQHISFGAVAKSKSNTGPQLGFGEFSERNLQRSGFLKLMTVVNNDRLSEGLTGLWDEINDCPNIYGMKFWGQWDDNGWAMEFGGPGGKCNN